MPQHLVSDLLASQLDSRASLDLVTQATTWTCDWHLKLGWGQSCGTKPFTCGIHHCILVDRVGRGPQLQDAQLVSGSGRIPCWGNPTPTGSQECGDWEPTSGPKIRLSFPFTPAEAPAYLRAACLPSPISREVAQLTDACRWPTKLISGHSLNSFLIKSAIRAFPQE